MTGIYGKINYICLTEFNKQKLLQLKQIKPEKVFIKPNFVDREVEIKEERKDQFVYAGRLDKLKGIDILLEAWKELGVKAPRLVVCGTGPMENWCKKFVEENNLNVEMKGFVSNEEALEIIGESKALILPTQLYEGFPMTIVEAFSVGTPVICTDLGNCGCIVENGITGWKFQENNITELGAYVHEVSKHLPNYEAITSNFESNYCMNKNYSLLSNIYIYVSNNCKV